MSKFFKCIVIIEGVIIILLTIFLLNTARNKSSINIDGIDGLFVYSNKNKNSNIFLGMVGDKISIIINHHQDRMSILLSDTKTESSSTLDIKKDHTKFTVVDLGLDGIIDFHVEK
jgi:hypothetical protein